MEEAIAEVTRIVQTMPLWKLQRVGDDVLDFLRTSVTAAQSSFVPAWRSASPRIPWAR